MNPEPGSLAERLISAGYHDLFMLAEQEALEMIWKEPGAKKALAALAVDSQAPLPARFYAAEILFLKLKNYPPEEDKKSLAWVYTSTLSQDALIPANTWALPDIQVGRAGGHILTLGEVAIPELVELFDHEKRVHYIGSQEPTLADYRGYRVKDVAAYLVGEIKGISLTWHDNPAMRDKEIEKLRKKL